MKALTLHGWDLSTDEARAVQSGLRESLILEDRIPKLTLVAGADIALVLTGPRCWERGEGLAVAGVVVYSFPEMEEIERVSAVKPLTFPYVPGLLSFREIPALLAAFEQVRHAPDLIFCDGQGYAHPRRFGLACHIGVLLDRPSIGVAKSILVGEYRALGQRKGSSAPLVDPKKGDTVGAALRIVNGVKPVYVSQGHRISLRRAIELTFSVSDGYRIPRPTRDADHFVRELRREETTRMT